MKILFLHGKESSPYSTKVTFLRERGHDVVAPALDASNWEQSVMAAREAATDESPDVVVGSSRGGAVAMAARIDAPMVLVAPAWAKYAPWATVSGRTIVVHAPTDDVVPFLDSLRLQKAFGCRVISAGTSHRMRDPDALEAIIAAIGEAA